MAKLLAMLSAAEEAERLYGLCGEDYLKALTFVEAQLNVVYTRAQVLVGISGMVITVTGFSGRTIADTSKTAQYCIIIGLAVVLAATVWVFLRVMRISWASSILSGEEVADLTQLIEYRNRKTISYEIGGKVLALGLIIYGIAVSMMLLN